MDYLVLRLIMNKSNVACAYKYFFNILNDVSDSKTEAFANTMYVAQASLDLIERILVE